ncbi:MAG: undecaprenyldiphospho-muramoylpentapeptide beta-N-acetylglucosaminyltransferase [Gammaproteobacteria bacterium]|nr:MAG: undecaprenyldiphospho-muramoylpentapeptide beta-N-acetylglucosaminyltransferase [Gammaproteobacteria bacterium]
MVELDQAKKQQIRKVLIMAGGTGGHVFPALAVARALIEQGVQVEWLGTRQGIEAKIVEAEPNIVIHYLNIEGIRGQGVKRLLMAPLKISGAIYQAVKICNSIRPDVVLGMGGFVTGPGGVAARLSGIPLVIHEQNAVAGMTNKMLSYISNKVFEAFPNTFPRRAWVTENRILATGNPVRVDIESVSNPEQKYCDRNGPIRILVLGGSQGAVALNNLVPETIAKIDIDDRPLIRHQVGPLNLDAAQRAYEERSVQANVVPFIDDMAEAYQWADFTICRAGALTLSELQQAGLPGVLVPYPYAVDDHQTRNAEVLVQAGGAVLVQQADIDVEQLKRLIIDMSCRDKLIKMAVAAKSSGIPNATETVVNQCLEFANA